jgi:hypothetical protein
MWTEDWTGDASPGATPSYYTAIACPSLGIYVLILLSSLSRSVEMIVPPIARRRRGVSVELLRVAHGLRGARNRVPARLWHCHFDRQRHQW